MSQNPSPAAIAAHLGFQAPPLVPAVDPDTLRTEIPMMMQTAKRWILWRMEPGESGHKPRKVPYYANFTKRSGVLDSPRDRENFVIMDQALKAMERRPGFMLGFALGPDGSGNCWQGIDLDQADHHPGHAELVEMLPGYRERSPSGNGYHAIGYGTHFPALASNATAIEAYASGRFFTVTGWAIGGDIADLAPFVVGTLVPLHDAGDPIREMRSGSKAIICITPAQVTELRSALNAIDPDSRETWIGVGQALTELGEVGKSLWLDWSQTSAKWQAKDAETWATFRGDNTGYQAVFARAQLGGWVNPASKAACGISGQPTPPPAAWPDPRPLPQRGDQGQAMPFPLDLLPEGVQRAAREVGRFVKVPPAAPALVGLAVLAVAIGKRAVVEERPGLHHSPASFFVGIAASGERKSPVFRTMTAPLEEWTQQAIQDWGTANKEAQANGQAVDAAIRGLKARAKDGIAVEQLTAEIADLEGKRVIAPPYPRLFTTDTTEQRLFQLMHERDGAFAVLSGEGRPVVDALLGKYSGEGRTGDGIFLAGVSGDIITRDRVGGEGGPEERIIHNPCLTTCILVQPDKYLEAANHRSLRASGALARIWPVLLPSLVGTRLEAVGELGLNAAEMANYHNSVTQILGFNPPTDDHERPIPHRVTLGPEATEARRQFHNAIETEMIAGGDLDDVRDLASKATTQTVKLAMILHLAQHPIHLEQGVSEIGPTTWAMAQKLGTWFLEEATRVQRLADEDPAIEDARRVLAWLASDDQRETITASEISQIGPRPRPSGDKAREILELLHDYNWLQPETLPGKRKPIWRLHPKLASLANLARESVSE